MSDKSNRSIDTHFRAEILREILLHIEDSKALGDTLSSFYNRPLAGSGQTDCLVTLRNDYAHKTAAEILFRETSFPLRCDEQLGLTAPFSQQILPADLIHRDHATWPEGFLVDVRDIRKWRSRS